MAKPNYRTFVVERHVDEPRAAVWDRVVSLVDAGLIDLPEELLSFEPPWRRVGRLAVDPLPLVEHTVAIRDDRSTCHLVWAAIAEVPEDGAPDVDAALRRVDDAITRWAGRAALAPGSAAGGQAVLADGQRYEHHDQQQ